MRGSTAKSLRAIAVGCATSYYATTVVRHWEGDTFTTVLNPVSKRAVYKKLKKVYKALAVKPTTYTQQHALKGAL